jgi:nitrogen regulatory protein PII-like uncharacterized protein
MEKRVLFEKSDKAILRMAMDENEKLKLKVEELEEKIKQQRYRIKELTKIKEEYKQVMKNLMRNPK